MPGRLAGAIVLIALAVSARPVMAQERTVHWDRLDVEARLDRQGTLHVAETQVMRFWGVANGGERTIRLAGRQSLAVDGVDVDRGAGWTALRKDRSLDDVDDYAVVGRSTIRWRSRLPSAAPFNNTVLRYRLRYRLSKILVATPDGYLLDHDVAFADREGPITQVAVRLRVDPEWRMDAGPELRQAGGPLAPGTGFVVTVPLRFEGAGAPEAFAGWRTLDIRLSAAGLLLFLAGAVAWLAVREHRAGRFAPLETAVDDAWLEAHVLAHPAEVVGAAWDGSVGTPEVVALIARLIRDGVIAPVEGADSLRLVADRGQLTGYARDLVEGLFFDGRTETSVAAVATHYRETGFRPASIIRRDLEAAVADLVPGVPPRELRAESFGLFAVGGLTLGVAWYRGDGPPCSMLAMLALGLVALVVAVIAGDTFRADPAAGAGAMWRRLTPAALIAGAATAYLWFYAGSGRVDVSAAAVIGFALVSASFVNTAVNALKSRQHARALAFRKTLTAAREYFKAQLRLAEPALRDDWYPWVLAFGLRDDAEAWLVEAERRPSPTRDRREWHEWREPAETRTAAGPPVWTGFGGGRSGGAGAGASWVVAADGLAAGVAAPRASSSSRSSDSGGSDGWSSSSDSSSSDSSSSGGGSGGAW